MPGDAGETAKNIAIGVAGSIGGNKVADKLHLGGAGHIASGVAGGMGANAADRKVEEKQGN